MVKLIFLDKHEEELPDAFVYCPSGSYGPRGGPRESATLYETGLPSTDGRGYLWHAVSETNRFLLLWLERRPLPATPPAAPVVVALDVPWVDLDDAEWIEAVRWQGVALPHGPDYYKSTHWQLLRAEYVTGRCALCARTGVGTTLHHRHYGTLGRERPDDFTEVCFRCHDRHHGAIAPLKRAA